MKSSPSWYHDQYQQHQPRPHQQQQQHQHHHQPRSQNNNYSQDKVFCHNKKYDETYEDYYFSSSCSSYNTHNNNSSIRRKENIVQYKQVDTRKYHAKVDYCSPQPDDNRCMKSNYMMQNSSTTSQDGRYYRNRHSLQTNNSFNNESFQAPFTYPKKNNCCDDYSTSNTDNQNVFYHKRRSPTRPRQVSDSVDNVNGISKRKANCDDRTSAPIKQSRYSLEQKLESSFIHTEVVVGENGKFDHPKENETNITNETLQSPLEEVIKTKHFKMLKLKDVGIVDILPVSIGGTGRQKALALLGDRLIDIKFYESLLIEGYANEGLMTQRRSMVVANNNLANVATQLLTPNIIIKSDWEKLSTHEKGTILEAYVGALFEQNQFTLTEEVNIFIKDLIGKMIEVLEGTSNVIPKDAITQFKSPSSIKKSKTTLLELMQKRGINHASSFFQTKSYALHDNLPPFRSQFQASFDLKICGLPDPGIVMSDDCQSKKEAEENVSAKVLKYFFDREQEVLGPLIDQLKVNLANNGLVPRTIITPDGLKGCEIISNVFLSNTGDVTRNESNTEDLVGSLTTDTSNETFTSTLNEPTNNANGIVDVSASNSDNFNHADVPEEACQASSSNKKSGKRNKKKKKKKLAQTVSATVDMLSKKYEEETTQPDVSNEENKLLREEFLRNKETESVRIQEHIEKIKQNRLKNVEKRRLLRNKYKEIQEKVLANRYANRYIE